MAIKIYTDGACRGNPGPGGWGVLLLLPEEEKHLSGAATKTTNNRMELMAAICALEALSAVRQEVELFTDSRYVMDGITQWIVRWRRRGWRTAAGKPVRNQDLWQRLEQATQQHQVRWQWVRGHSGDSGNEAADQLANQAIDGLMEGAYATDST